MFVYANLCGIWTELNSDDYIEDKPSQIFVNDFLSKKNLSTANQFLKVSHNYETFCVHISQIQWRSEI